MKIQCRLDYFFLSKSLRSLIADVKIVADIFSVHCALCLSVHTEEQKTKRGPGFVHFAYPCTLKSKKLSVAPAFGNLITRC